MCKRISLSHLRLFVTDEGLMTRELCDSRTGFTLVSSITAIVFLKLVLRVVLIL